MVREANENERNSICPATDGYVTSVFVYDKDGTIEGHLCLSVAFGQVFGHNTLVWSEDKTAATRLWSFARKWLKENGYNEVFIHFDDNTSEEIKEFWYRFGSTKIMEVYRLKM